jgi:hypothetical protein
MLIQKKCLKCNPAPHSLIHPTQLRVVSHAVNTILTYLYQIKNPGVKGNPKPTSALFAYIKTTGAYTYLA